MEDKKLNIFGEEYKMTFNCDEEDTDGIIYFYQKLIRIKAKDDLLIDSDYEQDKAERQKEVIRHELFHAIMFEIGEDELSRDEKFIQKMAMLSPKIFKILNEANAL